MMQIIVHIEHMTGNTNLIRMMMQEQMVHISKELDRFLHYIHEEGLVWFKRKILNYIRKYQRTSARLYYYFRRTFQRLYRNIDQETKCFDVEIATYLHIESDGFHYQRSA